MAIKRYHLKEQPIPDGFRIFEHRLEVAGVHARKEDAAKFVVAKRPWLELQHDFGNAYDRNAIKVMGVRCVGVRR